MRGWKITKKSIIIYAWDPDFTGQKAVIRTAEDIGKEYDAVLIDQEGIVTAQFYIDATAPQERKLQIEDVIETFKRNLQGA